MGSSPSSMWRLLPCHQAGVITLIAMVLSSSMYRCLCSPGIFAIIAIMLFPLLQCCCCHCQAGVVVLVMMASSPLSLRKNICRCHDGIIALVALVPSPTLHRHYPPCCTGMIVIIPLTSLLSLCMGIVAVVAPMLLPLSSWRVCAVECGYN
jgi:hypothetical protein